MNGELVCGSLFSGVGGMDIGFAWAGWRHAFFAEIEPFGRAVLAERFPGVPVYSDVRDVPECERGEWDRLDVLTFGSPCQDLSVAGKRRGLDGDRSGLFWEAMRIAGDGPLRPRALLMENVHGLLSSNGGRDFALVLDAMAERGYRWSYRVLDSQHAGVPQRRRRVFVLAIADDDPRAERIGEVLALAEGGGGDSPTREPSWPDVAARARSCTPGGSRVIPTVAAKWAKGSGGPAGDEFQNLVWGEEIAVGVNAANPNVAATLPTNSQGGQRTTDLSGAYVCGPAVRRLTPMECERLQGWPDGWTDIPWNGKPHAPDTNRYAGIVNGVTAPVAYWIAARLGEVLR